MSSVPIESSPSSVPDKMASIVGAPVKIMITPKAWQDSGAAIDRAKQLVVDNYNQHHDTSRTPPLTSELVFVVWFSKTLENWKAIVGSNVLKGLLYEVTHNGAKKETYLDVYKKINNVKVPD